MTVCRPEWWRWTNFFSTEQIKIINEKINTLSFFQENKNAPARNYKGETKKNCNGKIIKWDEISNMFGVPKK